MALGNLVEKGVLIARRLAALDLGHSSGGDAHDLGELGLGESVALAFFSKPLAALAGHQRRAAAFGLPPLP